MISIKLSDMCVFSDRAMTNHGNKFKKHLLTQHFLKSSKEFTWGILTEENENVQRSLRILFVWYIYVCLSNKKWWDRVPIP